MPCLPTSIPGMYGASLKPFVCGMGISMPILIDYTGVFSMRLRCSIYYFAPRLHPNIEEGACHQQEEDACEEDPCQWIRLMEVAPREDNRQTNRDDPDHLALECNTCCTPANIERDGEFTNSGEGK